MKKKMLVAAFIILSTLSFSEDRTAYILVPSGLDLKGVKVTGIVDGSSETLIKKDVTNATDSLPTLADLDGDVGVVVKESNISSYVGTKYVEMVVANIEVGDNVKFVMGYPVEGKDIPTYTVIASEDIKTSVVDGKTIEELFDSETRTMEDLVDATDFTYDTFPGKELQKDIRISGMVVGEQPMDESTLPSNIVDLYSKNGEIDEAINKVSGGAEINPNNSDKNSEFELWAIETDANGDIIPKTDINGDIIYKTNQDGSFAYDKNGEKIPESEKILLYTSKDSDGEDPLYGDLRSIEGSKGQLYPSDDLTDPYDHFVFDIDVRFKNANGATISINNEDVPIGLGTGSDKYKWQFYNVEDVILTFNGGNSFYFGLKGDEVGIVPPDGSDPTEIPLPVAEEFYAIDDEGGIKEVEADLISKYVEAEKQRESSINMKVLTETGEKNFEIKTMSE